MLVLSVVEDAGLILITLTRPLFGTEVFFALPERMFPINIDSFDVRLELLS